MMIIHKPIGRWRLIAGVLLTGLILLLAGCERKTTVNRLRLVNALPVAARFIVTDAEGGQTVLSVRLADGEATDYRDLDRGRYTLVCRREDRELAKRELILGTGGRFTAATTGIPEAGKELPPASTIARVSRLFEGEDANPVNRFIPRWQVWRDNIRGSRDKAYVKFVNLAAGQGPFTVESAERTIVEDLAYPTSGEVVQIDGGRHRFTLEQQGRQLAARDVEVRTGWLTTGVITGAVLPARQPRIIVLANPSRRASPSSAAHGAAATEGSRRKAPADNRTSVEQPVTDIDRRTDNGPNPNFTARTTFF